MLDIYINGKKADVDESVKVALTYQATDLDKPTATKTAYSKTISLKGTPTNNAIFAEQWKLDRAISGDFDAHQRIDCQIYRNGDLIEDGYICLNTIGIEKNVITYNITYYSKLGDFFYNLMYDSEDDSTDKRTLADLYYGFYSDSGKFLTKEEEASEVLLQWNMYNISDMWSYLMMDSTYRDNMYVLHQIVACPTYSGYYDDFDSDKILVDPTSATIPEGYFPLSFTEDDTTYTTKDGFLVMTAPRDLDEWEVGAFNSAQQRPAIRLSTVLKAISDPINNGGYTVNWDKDITKDGSKIGTYYNNSWIMMDKIDFSSTATETLKTLSLNSDPELTSSPKKVYLKDSDGNITFDTTNYQYPRATITMQHLLELETGGLPTDVPTTLYSTFLKPSNVYNFTFNCYRLTSVYIDEDGITQTYASTPVYAIMSSNPDDKTNSTFYEEGLKYAKKLVAQKYAVNAEDVIIKKTDITQTDLEAGYYTYTDNPISIIVKLPTGKDNVKVYVESATICAKYESTYDSTKLEANQWIGSESTPKYAYSYNGGYQQYNNPITKQFKSSDDDYTNAIYDGDVSPTLQTTACTKETILGSTETPYDYLIGFARLFGLKFLVNTKDKIVNILTRENYYRNADGEYDLVDFNDKIDWNKKVEIDNSVSESKWLNYGLETPESYAQYLYNLKYSGDYGGKYFNTNYNFNSDVNDIFEDTVYKNYLPYRLWSQYFSNPAELPSIVMSKTYTITEWDDEGNSADKTIIGYTGKHSTIKTLDNTPKICCFDKENSNVGDISSCLVFLNSSAIGKEKSGDYYPYIIYDNRQEMIDLNGNPCHLWTRKYYRPKRDDETEEQWKSASDYNICELKEYIPYFSKYYTKSGKVIASYDFVKPEDNILERFVGSDAVYDENTTLLEQFWFPYSADVYDKDGKTVTLYVTKLEKPADAMRKFYFFENSIWTINKITDYDVDDNTEVKVQFLKVKDISTYINYN